MKLSYSKVAVALLSSLSISVFAADIDIYGKGNLSLQSTDEGQGSTSEIKSNASRIGFKGDHDLGDSLTVFFKLEYQVDLDGDGENGDNIKDRNQYVGLKGQFGEVLIGKNDTVLKQSEGKIDLFNDLEGDLKNLWKGEDRVSNSIAYKTPSFSGFKLGVSYLAENSTDTDDEDDGYSIALFYGDRSLKKSKIYASVAMNSDIKGYDVTRASFQTKVAGVTLGAIVQTQEKLDGSDEMNGMVLSAKYGFDKIVLKGQYQTADFDGGDDRNGVSVGADYVFDKRAKLYTFFTSFDMDSSADRDYLAAGIEYKF
jgi:predicted porin